MKILCVFAAFCLTGCTSGQLDGFEYPKARMMVRESGLCGPEMFSARDMKFSMYDPVVVFDPNSVEIPKEVIVPGCIPIRARNVNIRKPIKELSAEFIMQIGSHPNPYRPADLPCGRRPDADLCGCEHLNNTCIFCDFCKRMKAQVNNYTITNVRDPYKPIKVRKNYGEECDCQTIPPGTYELEAQVCTPQNSHDIYNAVPEEFKERMGSGQPISMFTSIFLYDVPFKRMKPFSTDYAGMYLYKRLVNQRKNFGTVGCYLIASDIEMI